MADLAVLKKKADDLRNSGREEEAVKAYKQLIDLYTKAGDLKMAGWAQQMIGVSYKIGNHLDKAIPWYQRAIRSFKKIDDPWGVGNTLRDIGTTYAYRHRYKEAVTYFRQSATILKKATDNPAYLGITLVKLALAEMHIGRFTTAHKHFHEGLALIKKQGHWFFESTAHGNLAEYYVTVGQYDQALEHLEEGKRIAEAHLDEELHTRRLSQYYGLAAFCLVKMGKVPEAKRYFKKAEALLKEFPIDVREPVEEDIHYPELKKLLGVLGISVTVLANLFLGERL